MRDIENMPIKYRAGIKAGASAASGFPNHLGPGRKPTEAGYRLGQAFARTAHSAQHKLSTSVREIFYYSQCTNASPERHEI